MDYAYLKNGESLSLDQDICSGCGACIDVCPHAVFELSAIDTISAISTNSPIATIKRRQNCMECGACALNCPLGAISVQRGVGCAAAIIGGMIRGGAAECGCGCEPRGRRPGCC